MTTVVVWAHTFDKTRLHSVRTSEPRLSGGGGSVRRGEVYSGLFIDDRLVAFNNDGCNLGLVLLSERMQKEITRRLLCKSNFPRTRGWKNEHFGLLIVSWYSVFSVISIIKEHLWKFCFPSQL